jgi:hypothetical protein
MFGMIRKMFSDEKHMKAAFHAVKVDMDSQAENHEELKKSVNEWVIFLDKENRDLKMRVQELEKKLETLEGNLEEKKLSVLRAV